MELDQDMYDDNYDGTVKDAGDRDVSGETQEVSARDDALHLRGTDDMSTSDVHKYVGLFTTDSKPRIEWIDDTSLNLVYYTAEEAKIALAHLAQVPTDQVDSTTSHPAQHNPEKPDARLEIRYATTNDKKEKGAKDRSRWYLFHPEDDPDSRPKSGRRRNEPYSRTGRHERRMAAGTAGGKDLFAEKLSYDASSLPPAKFGPDLFEGKPARKEVIDGEDLFTSRLTEAEKMSRKMPASSRASLPANDLFARISSPVAGKQDHPRDLFADRLDRGSGSGKLADRISGGPIRSRGIHIKGAGRRAKAADLF